MPVAFSLSPLSVTQSSASRRRPSTLRCTLTPTPRRANENDTNSSTRDTSFSSWAADNRIDLSAISLTSFSDSVFGSRGMTANTSLKNNQQLISVSHNSTLQVTSLDRNKTPFPQKISQQTWQSLPWYARLALLIVNAKADSNESKWQPWIQRLPSKFDTPFHWTDQQLEQLQSPRMVDMIKEQRRSYTNLYQRINSNPSNALARSMTYNDFVWAVECVRSRAFSGPLEVAPFRERLRLFLFIAINTCIWPAAHVLPWEKALNGGLTALFALSVYDIITPKILKFVQGVELRRFAMTPGIDFLNHSSSVSGKAEVSYEYFSEKFVVQAGENYEEGEQVFISYGRQSNDSFLQYYGFVEEDNPCETYAFPSQVENALRVPKGTLVARAPSGFDRRVVDVVAKVFGGNKESAQKALRELCVAELANMPTTLEEDLAFLSTDECRADPRLQIAVRYRIEKKKLLTKALPS
eukprot:GFKZ01010652.1.p1 GENE.GFKZ01010652.1~~GFKZ01010652.1.p1  ORF type:complete len:467 (+),score=54.47 GFKZ01010652.1:139-1539(+)